MRKIFTRTILLISFVSFFTDIASEMLYPVMPVYLKSIGFSVLLIGILEGIAEFIAGLSKGYFGNLSDNIGKRVPFIRLGYSMSAISKPLMILSIQPLWVFFARSLDRIGKGLRTGARDAMLSAETIPQHKGKVFNFHRGMDTAGAAIGPLIALIFLYFKPSHYNWLFLFAFFPGIIAVLLTLLIKDRMTDIGENNPKTGLFTYLTYWKRSTKQYKLLIIGLLAFALFNSSDVFLLLTIKNAGKSDIQMIGYYIFYNFMYAFLSFPMGLLADKTTIKKVFIFGLLIFALVYLGFGFAYLSWHFFVLFLLYALYAASTEGISKAWISNICKQNEMATAFGFYNSFTSFTTFIASSLGGLIWSIFGSKPMFVFSATGTFLIAIYLLFLKYKLHESREQLERT